MSEIKQSYKLTVSSLNMMRVINTTTDAAKTFAQRFIVRLVEIVNNEQNLFNIKTQPVHQTEGVDIFGRNSKEWVTRTIEMPLSAIMLEGVEGKNHARKAIKAMQRTIIDYTDKNPKTGKTYWTSFPFVGRVTITDGIIHANIEPEIWQLIKDFSMGFRTYELQTMLKLRSVYSMKLYPYVCKQTDPTKLTMSIEDCMKFMGVQNKYAQKADFIKKCIDPAKAELDRIAPWSFEYTKLYDQRGKKGRPSITAIQFIPVHILENESPETIAKQVSPVTAGYFSGRSKDILLHKFEFENARKLARYNTLFEKASGMFDLDGFIEEMSLELDRKRGTRNEIKNPAGWFINTLQQKTEVQFNLPFGSEENFTL